MPKVIAIGPYSDTDAAALARDFDALCLPGLAAIAALPEDQRREVEAVAFMGHDAFDGAAMDLMPGLKAITNFGVGYDAIDVAAATARGVRVTNTPEVLNDDVADLAVAMWIAQARDFEPAIANARSGDWGRGARHCRWRARHPGARSASLAWAASGARSPTGWRPSRRKSTTSRAAWNTPASWTYHADPVDLARAVDDLIIAIVGGPETEGFVSASVIGALGPDGVIVNCSPADRSSTKRR